METAQAHQTAKSIPVHSRGLHELQHGIKQSVAQLTNLSELIANIPLKSKSAILSPDSTGQLEQLSKSELKLKAGVGSVARLTNDLVKFYNEFRKSPNLVDPAQLEKNLVTLEKIQKKIASFEAAAEAIKTDNHRFLEESKSSDTLVKKTVDTLCKRINAALDTALKVFGSIKRDAHNVRTELSNFSSSQTVVASSDETSLSLLAPSAPSTKTLQPQPKPNDPQLIAKFNTVAKDAEEAVRKEMQELRKNLYNLQSTIDGYDDYLNQERPIGISQDHFQAEKRVVKQAKLEAIKNLEKLRTEYESIQNSKTLYREKIVAYIRHELEGSQFTSDNQVPREVKLAAIPLDKKDTLISNTTLISKILGSKFTYANFGLRLSGDGSISLENRENGSKLSLVKADDGRMRVTITKNGIEQRLGTAWNDDALKLCERFAKGIDLGILRGGTPANREYYIPPADFLKDNPAQPHKDNPSTARKTGSLVRF
jgi:hypothetical protein